VVCWRTWWTGRADIETSLTLQFGVVPAKAGTHSHSRRFGGRPPFGTVSTTIERFRGMGPGLRRDDTVGRAGY
jgi:hypothetical protein